MSEADKSPQALIAKYGNHSVAMRDLYGPFLDGVFDILKGLKKDGDAKIAALDARVKKLEARPQLKYLGVWDQTNKYDEGAAVTWDGSLWIAKSASISVKPGGNGAVWQLAVKKGRDSR